VVFPLVTLLIVAYLWRSACTSALSDGCAGAVVQRTHHQSAVDRRDARFGAWVLSCAVFPALTLRYFGAWSRD